VSASSDSLAGAARDNNVISRQAAINTTTNHAPAAAAAAAAAALFRHHSPDGSSSCCLAAGYSQDGAESPRRNHVTVKGQANGRGLVSRGTTSRYLDDDNDDDDSDQSEVYPAVKPRRHPSHGGTTGRSTTFRPLRPQHHQLKLRHPSHGCPSVNSRRRRPLPTLSPSRLEPPRPGNRHRRRVKPARAKTRGRDLTTAAQSVDGYASDTPAAHGDVNVLRCSGYSSDSIDPTSVSLHSRRQRPCHVVSTAAQTAGNDVMRRDGATGSRIVHTVITHDDDVTGNGIVTGNDVVNQDGVGTGSGNGRLMSEAVERYLRAAAAWDERHGCSTCSSSSSDSSSDFDYYLDRPLSSASGLGWSSTAAIASPRKCSSAFKQCVVS